MLKLLFVPLLIWTQAAWSDASVDISEPSEVAALTELQEKVDGISSAVMFCINSGKEHADCLCESKALILDFNSAVERLFTTFPRLAGLDMVSFKKANGAVISQSLSGLEKQSKTALVCSR